MNLRQLQASRPWNWPSDTDGFLYDILRDKRADIADRLIAVSLAGEYTVINDRLAGLLLDILCRETEPEELRAGAAIAFGPPLEAADLEDEDDFEDAPFSWTRFQLIQERLHDLYADDSAPQIVRRHCLEASVRAPRDWHADAVRAAYAEEDMAWKLTAVFCMQYINGFEVQILESLANGSRDLRIEAAEAAGSWPVADAWPLITDILSNEVMDKDLLLAAIEAAAAIRPEQATVALGDFLDSDDEDIVSAASEAIDMAADILHDSEDEDYDDVEDDEDDGIAQ